MIRIAARIGIVGWLGLSVLVSTAQAASTPMLFDDFSHADAGGLRAAGWTLRDEAGHPGVPGATWSPRSIDLVDDATAVSTKARRGNRLLRLAAHTDGTPAGTVQSQVCHRRPVLRGTYAARVRFTDTPESGRDGDPVVQAFYAIGPLAHDLDPNFSEVDFEYLPNGGWGSDATRLYAISWQTVQIEPWRAFNAPHESVGSHAGWRVLVFQVEAARTRHFVDGRRVHEAGGRNVPAVPMSIDFSLWFSPAGLLPAEAGALPRRWTMDVDWVLHVPERRLDPPAVLREVERLRRRGIAAVDTLPVPSTLSAVPAGRCNL